MPGRTTRTRSGARAHAAQQAEARDQGNTEASKSTTQDDENVTNTLTRKARRRPANSNIADRQIASSDKPTGPSLVNPPAMGKRRGRPPKLKATPVSNVEESSMVPPKDNLVAEDHSSSNEDEDGNGDGDTEYGNEGQDGDDNQEEAANETVNDFDNDTADAPPARRTRQLVMSNTTSAIPSQTPLNDIRVSSSQDQNFSLGKHAADDDTDAQAYGPSKKNKMSLSNYLRSGSSSQMTRAPFPWMPVPNQSQTSRTSTPFTISRTASPFTGATMRKNLKNDDLIAKLSRSGFPAESRRGSTMTPGPEESKLEGSRKGVGPIPANEWAKHDPVVGVILTSAQIHFWFSLVAENAFGDHSVQLRQGLTAFKKAFNDNPNIAPFDPEDSLLKSLLSTGSSFRGSFKTAARKAVEYSYGFKNEAPADVLEIVKCAIKDSNFRFENFDFDLYSSNSQVIRTGAFLHPCILDVIQAYGRHANAEAYRFMTSLTPVPVAMIALVLSAIEVALAEFAETGSHKTVPFTSVSFGHFYFKHIEVIEEFQKTRPAAWVNVSDRLSEAIIKSVGGKIKVPDVLTSSSRGMRDTDS